MHEGILQGGDEASESQRKMSSGNDIRCWCVVATSDVSLRSLCLAGGRMRPPIHGLRWKTRRPIPLVFASRLHALPNSPVRGDNVKMARAFLNDNWLPKSVLCFRDYNSRKFLLDDNIAGVTVGLVALPLAMAFSIARG